MKVTPGFIFQCHLSIAPVPCSSSSGCFLWPSMITSHSNYTNPNSSLLHFVVQILFIIKFYFRCHVFRCPSTIGYSKYSVALSANEAMTCKLHGEKSWRLKDTFSGDSKLSSATSY